MTSEKFFHQGSILKKLLYICRKDIKDMTILITGASGFIGSFIVEEALNQGFDVWAGVRGTSSRKYLQDKRIYFAHIIYTRV